MKTELVTSAGIILFCGLLIRQALELPPARFESLGPAFFPLLVCGLIAGLSLLHMLNTLLAAHRTARTASGPRQTQPDGPRARLLTTATVLLFVAYGVVLEYTELSYPLLTFLFIAFCSWMLSGFRGRALALSSCVAAGLTAFIYVTFGVVLGTIFP